MTIDELNAKGYLEDVLFEYDKAELTEGARTSLQKNADWLRKWTSTRITVEGHADERGTNEYNLALGERRAAAVRDFLASLGVPATRMNIVSKGEECPLCQEDTEACWAQESPRTLRDHGEELGSGRRAPAHAGSPRRRDLASAISAAMRSAAPRGSGAAVIGRPTTR